MPRLANVCLWTPRCAINLGGVARSLLEEEPSVDQMTRRKLAITRSHEITIVLGMTADVYTCFLTAHFPMWIGVAAFIIAQGSGASHLIGRMLRANRTQDDSIRGWASALLFAFGGSGDYLSAP